MLHKEYTQDAIADPNHAQVAQVITSSYSAMRAAKSHARAQKEKFMNFCGWMFLGHNFAQV